MEIKFYEIIGVKHWKRFLMRLEAMLLPNPEARRVGNYNLKSTSLKSVKNFKKMLILNGFIHFIPGTICIYWIIKNILGSKFFSFSTPIFIVLFLVNLYCVLLQRYNWLRINKVLKKARKKNIVSNRNAKS